MDIINVVESFSSLLIESDLAESRILSFFNIEDFGDKDFLKMSLSSPTQSFDGIFLKVALCKGLDARSYYFESYPLYDEYGEFSLSPIQIIEDFYWRLVDLGRSVSEFVDSLFFLFEELVYTFDSSLTVANKMILERSLSILRAKKMFESPCALTFKDTLGNGDKL